MFELPRIVIKSGRTVVEQGEIREPLIGKTMHVAPSTTVMSSAIFRRGSKNGTPFSGGIIRWTRATCAILKSSRQCVKIACSSYQSMTSNSSASLRIFLAPAKAIGSGWPIPAR